MSSRVRASLGLLAILLLGCNEQQYVSPDTVGLVISDDSTGEVRVNRCNYIPVLLGSQVKARYVVKSDLKATITITREEVEVSFQDPDRDHEPFLVPAETFEEGDLTLQADSPPDGYSVTLSTPCTPDD
jgi:hypothetical protein